MGSLIVKIIIETEDDNLSHESEVSLQSGLDLGEAMKTLIDDARNMVRRYKQTCPEKENKP